ncbi:10546_t:CDS:2 [Cetraspora pellucida]|uniref:10546_t:CDS:1 n=1 Tax=Cetraspora pellucida TaxID=1433469 RepID=A0A9N9GDA7_9GLOM|nr:10546_t:CDS:2 [Cetraspora pellucida]
MRTLIKQTSSNLLNGIYPNQFYHAYPNQFYHAFGKSQVVDISKVLTGKDIWTVTAQDLTTYFIDQVVQLERNRRITWRDTGIEIGMILNQNMGYLFKEMQKFISQGGIFVEADATAFDSHLNRFLFEGLKLENHPKRNEITSIFKCKYDQIQDAYIFGITEYSCNIFSLGIDSFKDYQYILAAYPNRYITYKTFIDNINNENFLKAKIILQHSEHCYSNTGLAILTNNLEAYNNEHCVVVTSVNCSETIKLKQKLKDKLVNKIILDPQFRKEAIQTDNWSKIYRLWHEIINGQLVREAPLYCIHSKIIIPNELNDYKNYEKILEKYKKHGGGTEQSATSWDNTWAFRITFIAAWLHYHNYKYLISDFFKQNLLYNNGDDSIWGCKIKRSRLNMDRFIDAFNYFGMDLEVEFHNDIEAIQYLVYHDNSATLQRRISTRYYQASPKSYQYLHASIMRSLAYKLRVEVPHMTLTTDQKCKDKNKWFLQVNVEKKKMLSDMSVQQRDFINFFKSFKFPTYYSKDTPYILNDELTEFFQQLPRQSYKYQPTILTLLPDPTFHTISMYSEKFLYPQNFYFNYNTKSENFIAGSSYPKKVLKSEFILQTLNLPRSLYNHQLVFIIVIIFHLVDKFAKLIRKWQQAKMQSQERHSSDRAAPDLTKDYTTFHEKDTDMLKSFDLMKQDNVAYKIVLSSATPSAPPQILHTTTFDTGFETANSQRSTYALHRGNSTKSIPDDQMNIATNVINAGIDIKGLRCLIDTGLDLVMIETN